MHQIYSRLNLYMVAICLDHPFIPVVKGNSMMCST